MGSKQIESRRIEGTWEEVLTHADELRGKHVVLTVLDEVRPLTAGEEAERQQKLQELWNEVERLAANPPPQPPSRSKPDPFGDALVDEYNQQLADFHGRAARQASGDSK